MCCFVIFHIDQLHETVTMQSSIEIAHCLLIIFTYFYRVKHIHSAVSAVVRCLSVRPSHACIVIIKQLALNCSLGTLVYTVSPSPSPCLSDNMEHTSLGILSRKQ